MHSSRSEKKKWHVGTLSLYLSLPPSPSLFAIILHSEKKEEKALICEE